MYRDLAQYLTERLAATGQTPTSFAERQQWGPAYINNILNGQFRPSRKRCIEIAGAFGDDPNIILALAGFYVPPESDHEDYLTVLNGLDNASRELALEFLLFLRWRLDRQNGNS